MSKEEETIPGQLSSSKQQQDNGESQVFSSTMGKGDSTTAIPSGVDSPSKEERGDDGNSAPFLHPTIGRVAALFGIAGPSFLLVLPVHRLWMQVVEAMSTEHEIHSGQYFVLFVWTAFAAYFGGYKGFQSGISLCVAERAAYIRDHCTCIRLVLAPIFALGFIESQYKLKIAVVGTTICIVGLILLFENVVPQPWRGILDFGVIVGLVWGLVALLILFVVFCFVEGINTEAAQISSFGFNQTSSPEESAQDEEELVDQKELSMTSDEDNRNIDSSTSSDDDDDDDDDDCTMASF